jgi:predicted patatin/cPLA2 family phospholipase
MLTGTNHEQVISALKRRKQDRSNNDKRKVALVVEGGGMRGVLSAGALLALDILGYRPCFEAVLASSAGSANAAYFLSGQGELGMSTYFEDLNNIRFFNPLRVNKILDVDYAYDVVATLHKPLDEGAIRLAKADFFVTVTNVLTGDNELINVSRSTSRVTTILKASSALPILYNRTVQIGDASYVDGGVSSGPPLDWAISLGFSDILFLSTRPSAFMSMELLWYERALFSRMLGRQFPSLMQAYIRSPERENLIRRLASGSERHHGVNIATLCPDQGLRSVNRTTTSRDQLIAGARKAGVLLAVALGEPTEEINSVFHAIQHQLARPRVG